MAGGMVEPVKIFLSTSLITMQNLTAAGHTVWAYMPEIPKVLGVEAQLHWVGKLPDPVETHPASHCVIIPNLVDLVHTVWSHVGVL